MASELKLELVTPFGRKYSNKITSCKIPGALGQFQALKNHAAFISLVEGGLIKIEEPDGKEIYLATSGGYCEINKNQVKVIVESAEFAFDIDLTRAEASKKRAEQRISIKAADVDVERAKLALARATNRIKVAQLR